MQTTQDADQTEQILTDHLSGLGVVIERGRQDVTVGGDNLDPSVVSAECREQWRDSAGNFLKLRGEFG